MREREKNTNLAVDSAAVVAGLEHVDAHVSVPVAIFLHQYSQSTVAYVFSCLLVFDSKPLHGQP